MKASLPRRLILILGLGLLLAVLLLNEHLVPAGDNATYMVLAQSLATGRGYRMISDPRLPEMALYPPGYPLLLGIVLVLTGNVGNVLAGVLPMKLISVALYLGVVVLVHDLLIRRNTTLAGMTALLTAVNPHVLHFAAEVSTEIPYLFLSLACLWVFERYGERPSPQRILWTAALLSVAFYVRSLALVMAVAMGGYLLAKRRFAHAALLLLIVAALALPWFVRTSSLPSTGTSVGLGRGYFDLYFSSDPYSTSKATLSDWASRLSQNLRIYALEIWPDVLFPHALSAKGLLGEVGAVVGLVVSLLLLLGFVLEVRQGRASEGYVAVFFASCLAYLWAQSRLVVPIIPMALYYLLVAVRYLVRRLSSKGEAVFAAIGLYALPVIVVLLAASALTVDVRRITRNLDSGLGQPIRKYFAADAEWSNYLRAMEWVAQNAPQQAVVMARKADLLYLLTGHQALEYPYSAEAVELKDAVYDNHVAYVIEDAFTWTGTTTHYLRPALSLWLAGEPAALSLVYETESPATRVWRVDQ